MPYTSKFPNFALPNRSLSDVVLEKIAKFGDATAMVDNARSDISITFEEITQQIRRCAGFLNSQGLRKGDVVGLCASNCLEFPVIMFGIMACGATVNPCNPAFSKAEVLQQFNISEPRMVFVDEGALKTMQSVKGDLPCLQKIFLIGNSEEVCTFSSMMKPEYEKDFPEDVEIDPVDDVALMPHSSGTTGPPKCVMLTHTNLLVIMALYGDVTQPSNLCFYTDRPMYNMGGVLPILSSLACGNKMVIETEFEIEKMLALIEKHNVTDVVATPPVLIDMANTELCNRYDTSSLKCISCSGAALPIVTMRTVEEKYKVQMYPVYGMTECAPIALNSMPNKFFTSVGSIMSNTIVKITDLKTGEELGYDKDGEICVKGPQVMKGYLKNPAATNAAIDEDGWLHTGDIGHFDKHEMLYVVDRIKEIIKYKTLQVSPAELEGVLLKHEKIADAGVIGIPDSYAGELPKAFVVRKDDSLTAKEVTEFVKGELAEYKQLKGGVEFVDAVPKSALGKILQRELKKMAK